MVGGDMKSCGDGEEVVSVGVIKGGSSKLLL